MAEQQVSVSQVQAEDHIEVDTPWWISCLKGDERRAFWAQQEPPADEEMR
jgi:hypothetical protein